MNKICTYERKARFKKTFLYPVIYTLLFLFIASIFIGYFYLRDKSFLKMLDSISQHFTALCYTRNYLRTLIKGVLTGSGLSFPMVDFSVGQGFDIIGTLNYYGFGNPLNLLTVFFPHGAEEIMYTFMLFLYMYLAGLAFFCYCNQLKIKNKIYIVIGSLLYAYCSFALQGGFKHIIFMTGILYLPLLLIGVERLLQKKSILFLAIIVAFSFMCNYYFMYMNTVLAAIYFFVRLHGRYKLLQVKGVLHLVLKVFIAYLWGVGLAGIILFPSVYAFMNNARGVASGARMEVFYNIKYYGDLLEKLIFSTSRGFWSIIGIGMLGFFSILIFWIRRDKKNKQLFIGFIILLLMLCFPAIGSLMNGFSYVSNRWSYGFAFLSALIAVVELPNIKSLTKKQLVWLNGILVLTVVWILKFYTNLAQKHVYCFLAIWILVMLSRVLYKFLPARIGTGCITAISVLTILLNIQFQYGTGYRNWTRNFKDIGWTTEKMQNSDLVALNAVEDESFYRIEQYWDDINYSLYTGQHYTNNFYFSIIPKTMSELYQSVLLGANDRIPILSSLESRAVLTAISSTKYYVSKKDNSAPYGYKKSSEVLCTDGSTSYLYENTNALPLGYTYDQTMSRENYEKLTALEKEQTLLDYAVVDDSVENISSVSSGKDYDFSEKQYTVKEAKMQKRIKNNKIRGKRGESITFNFEGNADCENYLYIEGYSFNGKTRVLISGDNDFSANIKLVGQSNTAYIEKGGALIHLGYSEKGMKEFTLNFIKSTNIKFEDIKIICVPMSDFSERINERKEEALENIVVSTNKIVGDITTTENKVLQLSIPYSIGWSVYVDGKKTATFESSIAYTGIYLEPGEHKITLKYVSPWMIPGIICSLSGGIAIVVYLIIRRKKNIHVVQRR